jgi:hypothetical protein
VNIADLKECARSRGLVVLFGAGMSADAPSNLPVGPSLSHAITLALEGHDLGPRLLCPASSHIDPASDTTWWEVYERISGREAFRLEVVLEMMTIVLGTRGLEVLAFMNDVSPNQNHYALARLAAGGTTLLTTNFDCCVEQAHLDLASAHIAVLADDEDILRHYSHPRRALPASTIVKLHGSLRYPDGQAAWRTIVATLETLSTALSEPKRRILDDSLRGRTLLIAGYSARDFFDIYPYLMQQTATDAMVWINHARVHSLHFDRYSEALLYCSAFSGHEIE